MEARPQRLPPQKELSCALAHDGGYPLIRWHSSSLFLPHPPPPSADGDGLLFANEGENSSTSIIPYADSRKADGICHRLSCYPVFPNAACPRRLCQPPWTQPSHREPRPPRMGAQVRRKSQVYSQLLFGRGSGGGASLREAASPGVPRPPVTSLVPMPCGGR